MRMGDAEFGLRAYRNGIISISNPEAYRIHLKSKQGGLRKFGSWDAFSLQVLKPRPIPSVLYYARKNFGNYTTFIYLLINLPLSLSKYSKKTDHLFTFISLLLFLFIFPIILLQTFNFGFFHQIFYPRGIKYHMKIKFLLFPLNFLQDLEDRKSCI